MGGNVMNRLGLLILATLKQSNATSIVTAMSIYEIKTYASLSQSITTMHRTIKFLLKQGYIQQGVKNSKSSTFYLLEDGLSQLKEMI